MNVPSQSIPNRSHIPVATPLPRAAVLEDYSFNPIPSTQTHMSYAEVRDRFSVSRSTVYVFIKRYGFPKPYRVGGCRRFLVQEVNAWAADRQRSAIATR